MRMRCSWGIALAIGVMASSANAADAGLAAQRARESFETYKTEHAAAQAAMDTGDPAEIEKHLGLARQALLTARQSFEDSGAPAKLPADTLKTYIDVLRALGYYDLAAEALERLVQLAPQDATAWALLGDSALQSGPKHEARGLEALRKSLALDAASPASSVAHLALGKLYYQQGLYVFAEEALAKAVTVDPANVEATIRLAALRVRAGKILDAGGALDALDKAAKPYDALTRVLLRENIAAFENDGRYFEDTPELHEAYGKLLYRAARLPEALLASARAVTQRPGDTKLLNFIGSMYLQVGNVDAARQAYEKSLAADANQPMVKEVLDKLAAQAAQSAPAPAAPAPAAPAPPALAAPAAPAQ